MEVEKEIKKMTLGHEIGAGAACLKCKGKCEGFELHFWRKICRNCKCGLEDHDVQMDSAENKKVGRLFEDTKYKGLITKLKTDGLPAYNSSVVTLPASVAQSSALVYPSAGAGSGPPPNAGATPYAGSVPNRSPVPNAGSFPNTAPLRQSVPASPTVPSTLPSAVPLPNTAPSPHPVPARKDVAVVPVKTVTYEWAPPAANQYMAVRYIELLPPEKRPIAGSEGADYRKHQMARQLPEHDQDPSRCHELSPGEVKLMQQYVRKYKDEALGMGDLKLPEEMSSQPQAPGAGAKGTAAVAGALGTAAAPGGGSSGPPGQAYACRHCQRPMAEGEPAVYAERAGYDKLWHPACFVCCTCSELLVDMIYFWKKGKLYCGRHYGDSEKPRCGGCDELIFSNEYTQAEEQNWHLKHFCCFDCDCVLAGETYVMEKDKPVCKPCYMKNHAVRCQGCGQALEPEAQRVSYGEHHWHAEAQCFRCAGCSTCLIGQRFMAQQGVLFCSTECRKKRLA